VPLDGSQLAESVLPMTTRLCRCLGATLILLHVLEERPPRTVHGQEHLTSTGEAEKYLERVAAGIGPGVEVETHVHTAPEHDVAASIAEHTAELEAGMAVMCVHGPGGPRRLVLGSIGQQVLQRVTIPVLLGRQVSMTAPAPSQARSILVPLDGKAAAEEALQPAVEIASLCGARIRVVRVVPTVETLTGDASAAARMLPISAGAALDEEEGVAAEYVEDVVGRLTRQGVHADGRTLRGDTTGAVAEEAAAMRANLIIMATHGRAGLGALWTGSVALGLLNRTPQPLLLVRVTER
jgi:nucleotide-binding universal stress UspA family protein